MDRFTVNAHTDLVSSCLILHEIRLTFLISDMKYSDFLISDMKYSDNTYFEH